MADDPKANVQAPAEAEAAEDEAGLPFPRARIVNLIRESTGSAKQIRSEVKDAINIWLGNLLKGLAREMGNTQYGSIGMADFQRATRPFDMISDIVKDEQRLITSLDKLKLDADYLIREMQRFFATLKGRQQENL